LKIFTTKKELSDFLSELKKEKKIIGLVPTMGALHEGHVSLIELAKKHVDLVVCSIFVNPTQFNDPQDLEKYPRPIAEDKKKLEKAQCDVLFLPEVKEMYRESEQWQMELGELENILEGKFRPNHYQGVTQIVKKLLDAVMPDKAFFGQKDIQQFLVIQTMVKKLGLTVRLVMCPIVRENDGLAMSSRNIHLSGIEHKQALALSKALQLTKENFSSKTIQELKTDAEKMLKESEGVKLEYFEISNATTLEPTFDKNSEQIVALVAAYVGNTRLIDNLILK
jgi:pantoate--beta-alanine ligase